MAKQRTGYVYYDDERKVWTARITFTDETGQRRNVRRQAENKTEAKLLLKRLSREFEDHSERAIDADRMTFRKLADIYADRKLIEPVYRDGVRVAGLRSWKVQRLYLHTLISYFGTRRVKAITHADIEKFKAQRLAQKTRLGRERSAANIHRVLALMRSIFNFAFRTGWIARNPFEMGDPLISVADEVKRERILTLEEEARLLAACTGRRAHLRPMLIMALDTAMRLGELLKLKWSDVDPAGGLIKVRATTTKTMRPRTIGMTSRLADELRRLRDTAPSGPDDFIFGGIKSVKTAFWGACEDAGISDFRFHDCRHTGITRMIQRGMPPMEVMKISGHTEVYPIVKTKNWPV